MALITEANKRGSETPILERPHSKCNQLLQREWKSYSVPNFLLHRGNYCNIPRAHL